MRLDVVYAMHVTIGDIVVGEVNLNAPTRPVQPFAAGMEVHAITQFPPRGVMFWYGPGVKLQGFDYDNHQLIMVIRYH